MLCRSIPTCKNKFRAITENHSFSGFRLIEYVMELSKKSLCLCKRKAKNLHIMKKILHWVKEKTNSRKIVFELTRGLRNLRWLIQI